MERRGLQREARLHESVGRMEGGRRGKGSQDRVLAPERHGLAGSLVQPLGEFPETLVVHQLRWGGNGFQHGGLGAKPRQRRRDIA